MNLENLKSEFYKQTNTLLGQLSVLNEDTKTIVDNITLDNTHIDEINTNISPYINDIIVNNCDVFKNNNIELIKNINLSKLVNSMEIAEKINICKYLQTIYLIINTYNKENRTDETKHFMKKIKSSLTSIETHVAENPDVEIKHDVGESESTNNPQIDAEVNEAFEQFPKLFGDNPFMNTILGMTKQVMSDPKMDMSKIMSGDNNELSNMMNNITNIMKEKESHGEINPESINSDAMDFMKNMLSNKNNPLNTKLPKTKTKKKKKSK